MSVLLATVHLQTVLQESCGVETPRNEERLLVRIRVLEQVQPEETHEEVWTLRLNWMLEPPIIGQHSHFCASITSCYSWYLKYR